MNKSDSGIFCPACKMKNEVGAVLCTYCRTPLQHNNQKTISLMKLQETGTLPVNYDVLDFPAFAPERFMDFEIPSKGIVLINLESGKPVTIQQNKAFILGRASNEIKTREPLVDLTDLGALDYGISRVHALIRKVGKGYQITDLDSTNGTWVDNHRIKPQIPTWLQSGDRIRLARMNILVFYPGTS